MALIISYARSHAFQRFAKSHVVHQETKDFCMVLVGNTLQHLSEAICLHPRVNIRVAQARIQFLGYVTHVRRVDVRTFRMSCRRSAQSASCRQGEDDGRLKNKYRGWRDVFRGITEKARGSWHFSFASDFACIFVVGPRMCACHRFHVIPKRTGVTDNCRPSTAQHRDELE